jgi:cell shape-determining protein MreC
MNYLRDNRLAAGRRQRKIRTVIFSAIFILLVILVRKPIFNILSTVASGLGIPFWTATNTVKEEVSGMLQSKQSLLEENKKLNDELMQGIAEAADRKVLLDENLELKKILGRSGGKSLTLAAILAKPNKSPYDTLVVDTGADLNIKEGQRVFAYGNIFIGTVAQVYANTSLVKLFSTPKETTDVTLGDKNAFVQAIGRGGGNFEITVPKDQDVPMGSEAVLPGITPYVLGIAEEIISDPRDPFQKILFRSPINVQDLKFVQIEK